MERRLARICKRCLFYEGMPFFLETNTVGQRRARELKILEDGVCSICAEYSATVEDARREAAGTAVLEELRRNRRPSIIAVSGGKDSLSTLYLVRRILDLEVIAFFYDSGFILPGAIEQLRRVCSALGVPLRESVTTETNFKVLEASVSSALPGDTPPCHYCSRAFFPVAASLAQEVGTEHILCGTNHFWRWPESEQPVGVLTHSNWGPKITVIALPYLLGVTREQVMGNLAELGATACVSASGLSTNCRVPELVQARVGAAVGHVPELEMLSIEVLVGHLTREAAAHELVRKVRASGTPNLQWMAEAFGKSN
jgi:hypothetical protein